MNHFFISGLLNSIIWITLGIFVYLKNRRNPLNWTFSLFAFSAVTYAFGFSQQAIASTKESSLFWIRIILMGTIFIPIFFLQFIYTALGRKIDRRILSGLYFIGITFEIINFSTEWFAKNPIPKYAFRYLFQAGFLYPILFLFFAVIVILAFLKLHNGYRTSTGLKRTQLKYLFWAPLIGFTGGSTGFLLGYNCIFLYPVIPIATYGVSMYGVLITYAIIVHNLMDLNIIIRKTLIYSVLISFISIINVIVIFLFENIFKGLFGYRSIALTLLIASIITITFFPLYRLITSFVDKLFFKKTMAALARENEMLKEEISRSEKLASLGVMASGLAHEIKNPLAPIKTYIQNLPKNLSNPSFIDKITKLIPEEVDKITDIINQLRDFANPPLLSITKVNIHNLIDKRLNLLEQEFTLKNITVEKQYSPNLPEINADPIQLERVFLNLFLNAIDAMPGGGRLTISTEICSNNSILIKVSDTGIGISKEDLPHIFDPFYTKGKQKGTGLGLAITYQIIKEHGGSIRVESTVGKGTTFLLCFPYH